MFTRVVEITAKAGKAQELANTIQEKALPILRKQAGFLDETVLTSDTESNRVVGNQLLEHSTGCRTLPSRAVSQSQ
jgi:Antibiotic biosynthesis monooxygenase